MAFEHKSIDGPLPPAANWTGDKSKFVVSCVGLTCSANGQTIFQQQRHKQQDTMQMWIQTPTQSLFALTALSSNKRWKKNRHQSSRDASID
jgi:hypothetical protein